MAVETAAAPSKNAYEAELAEAGQRARQAADALRSMTRAPKDAALYRIASLLRSERDRLAEANAKDLAAAEEKGLSSAMVDRLRLTNSRIESMAAGLETVAQLEDPVGQILDQRIHPNGMRMARMRQPIGVVGIIYESRPNVTADAAGLCLKSGNACILRGGSEAFHSNTIIARLFVEGACDAGIPEYAVQTLTTTDRAAVGAMLQQQQYIDLIVPRGGKGLIERILRESRIPVVAHLDGVCHVYLHEDAAAEMAQAIAVNAKLQRPGVCNAMETLLVHADAAQRLLPPIAEALRLGGCALRGDARTQALVACERASEDDWTAEYLDAILAIKVVDSLEDAIAHINRYGSHHTDSIVTEHYASAERFLDAVDSASVFVNASTRFSDGFEFGLGAEIGISTDKLHCRGPMGLEGLTTVKWIVRGNGQIRE